MALGIEERKRRDRDRKRKKYRENPEYRRKNNEHSREFSKEWHGRLKINTPWLLHQQWAKSRCDNPNQRGYKNYGGKGIEMLLTKKEIEIIYKRDGAKQMKEPSLDRIDSSKNYDFNNCRFIERSENCRQGAITVNKQRWGVKTNGNVD